MSMEQLIVAYQNRIYNVILKMCGNTDDAAELTQETFVKAIENIDDFKEKCGFYTWIFRIAVNLTINHCTRRSKVKYLSLDTEYKGMDEKVSKPLREFLADSNMPNPALVIQEKEEYEIIIKLLLKMDSSQRAVIILRDIEGMNYTQISKTLNIEPGTVKSRLSRARNTLREIFELATSQDIKTLHTTSSYCP